MSKLRILLADDHALFRDGIASLLAAWDMEVVGQAENGLDAIQKAEELHPDIILMDVHMPEMNGLEALYEIREKWPEIQVVMLTFSDDDDLLFKAIKGGARGYLLKNLDAHKFGELLSGLAQGEVALSPVMASKILNEFVRQSEEPSNSEPIENEPNKLTDRENDVLVLLADGQTNKEIAESLCVSENTVKYHIRNIFSKLQLNSRTEAAIYAIRKGIVDSSPNKKDTNSY